MNAQECIYRSALVELQVLHSVKNGYICSTRSKVQMMSYAGVSCVEKLSRDDCLRTRKVGPSLLNKVDESGFRHLVYRLCLLSLIFRWSQGPHPSKDSFSFNPPNLSYEPACLTAPRLCRSYHRHLHHLVIVNALSKQRYNFHLQAARDQRSLRPSGPLKERPLG